jgi:hypothetical protein
MGAIDELWLPLVDEPIGQIVERMQAEDAEIARLVESPRRLLAFRTFAHIRVGLVLGQLLFDHDLPPYDGSDEWVERLLRDEAHHRELRRAVRAVAEQIARDYADDEALGPDEAARERFREFARQQLEAI